MKASTSDVVMAYIARKYFEEVRKVSKALTVAKEHLATIEGKALPSAINYSSNGGGEPIDVSDIVAEMEQAENELYLMKGHWENVLEEANDVISGVEDPLAFEALYFFYVCSMSETETCEKMSVSRSTFQNHKFEGLIEAYQYVPEEWKRMALPAAVMP